MPVLVEIGGGVALILFAVRFLRKGLDRLFGQRLGRCLEQLASNRLRAFAAGLGLAVVAPSSTTMSVLSVQTVLAGQMGSREALAVMLGADIGMTAMVFLVAFRFDAFAPALLLVGIVLFQFTRPSLSRGVGQILTSLGLLFVAVGIIREGGAALAGSNDIHTLLRLAQNHPLAMALLATALAVLMQSGTATILLVMALAGSGEMQMPLTAGLAAVAGANVGIAVTTLVVGWRGVESRRLAVGNLGAKLSVALVVILCLPYAGSLLEGGSYRFELVVAEAHTAFNLVMAAVFLPLLGPVHRLACRIVPTPPVEAEETFGPRYIGDGASYGLAVALGQSMREILHASEIARGMLGDMWTGLKNNDARLIVSVEERDDRIDLLDTQIKRFLTRVIGEELDEASAAEQMRQLRYLNDLETTGDIIDKNLCELALKKIKLNVDFSADGWRELDDFYAKVAENMLISDTVFTTRDRLLAQQLLRHKDRLARYERELRDRHFARLKAGLTQTHETSAIHLDLLTHLKRINSTVSHVAYMIVQSDQ